MSKKVIMSLDYSFSNSGVCISEIIDDKIVILYMKREENIWKK